MVKSKIFAAYLPQYYETPENNEFWGKGFTDWVGVKNSKPLFNEHNQPRIPLNNNYYDLSKIETIEWQANLAKEYGISGFNIYHYWFKNAYKVLEKPAEIILNNSQIDIEYFFSWDNTSWVRSWSNIPGNAWAPKFDNNPRGKKILLEMEYGDENDWKKHFNYLLPFFKDERYLKINNRPVIALMRQDDRKIIQQMFTYWEHMAIQNGFDGLYGITGKKNFGSRSILEAEFIYQPRTTGWAKREALDTRLKRYFGKHLEMKKNVKYLFEYKDIWEKILNNAKRHCKDKLILCGFVRYDDAPRRGKNACVIVNDTPGLFGKYFSELYTISCKNNKPFILLTAWNEWGEGAYLEPDMKYKKAYLKEIKKIVDGINKENDR